MSQLGLLPNTCEVICTCSPWPWQCLLLKRSECIDLLQELFSSCILISPFIFTENTEGIFGPSLHRENQVRYRGVEELTQSHQLLVQIKTQCWVSFQVEYHSLVSHAAVSSLQNLSDHCDSLQFFMFCPRIVVWRAYLHFKNHFGARLQFLGKQEESRQKAEMPELL